MQRVCTIRSTYTVRDVDGKEIDQGWEDDSGEGSEGVAVVVHNRSLANAVVRYLRQQCYRPRPISCDEGRDSILLDSIDHLVQWDDEWPGEYQTCLHFEGLQPGELTRIFRNMTRSVK